MATVVNNDGGSGGNGMGFLLGVIILIVFAYLVFVYGLPALRGAATAPQINVPGNVNVNLKQTK